jgi:hypothetical protein
MSSPYHEIQLLRHSGTDREAIINRIDVFVPTEMALRQAQKELEREPKADGVRILDALDRELFRLPERD